MPTKSLEQGLVENKARALEKDDLFWTRQGNRTEDSVYDGQQLIDFVGGTPVEDNKTGTAYTLTASTAQVALGGVNVEVSINRAGTYLLQGEFIVNYNAATFAAVRSLISKLRRTNNSAADVANSTRTVSTRIVTTETSTMMVVSFSCLYTATASAPTTADVIGLWAHVSTLPSAGSLQIVAAYLKAIRLAA